MYSVQLLKGSTLPSNIKMSCTTQGICNPQDAYSLAKIKELQRLINDVRVRVGLAPTLAIDGSLGPSTAVALIKLAEKLMPSAASPESPPPVIEKFAVFSNDRIPGAIEIAREVEALIVALKMYLPAAPSSPPSTSSKKGLFLNIIPKLMTSKTAVSPPIFTPPDPSSGVPAYPSTQTYPAPVDPYTYSASSPTSKLPTVVAVIGLLAALGGIAFMIHHSRKNA